MNELLVNFNPQQSLLKCVVRLKHGNNMRDVDGVIDTAASYLVVKREIITELGLTFNTDTISVKTASNPISGTLVTLESVRIRGSHERSQVEAIVADLPDDLPIQVLVGWSFLKHFKLFVDYGSGYFNLSPLSL